MLNYNRTLWISDVHTPNHDDDALKAVREIIYRFKPHNFIVLGDFFDSSQLSTYSKPPGSKTTREDIEVGVEVLNDLIVEVKKSLKSAKCFFLLGNHEERIYRRMNESPGLHSLIDPHEVFGLTKLGFDHIYEYNQAHIANGVYTTHGHLLRKFAGAGYLTTIGMNGVSGHTHKLSSVSKTMFNRRLTWCESGHLCKVSEAKYGHHKDWQQGCVIGAGASKNAMITPSLVHIDKGEITAGFGG